MGAFNQFARIRRCLAPFASFPTMTRLQEIEPQAGQLPEAERAALVTQGTAGLNPHPQCRLPPKSEVRTVVSSGVRLRPDGFWRNSFSLAASRFALPRVGARVLRGLRFAGADATGREREERWCAAVGATVRMVAMRNGRPAPPKSARALSRSGPRAVTR